ncbi:PEP-CTERM sorting domain-containing protein [Rubrivivax rivuli]|uniref:PEP-CTERM sorting domain-containing protein n=1 Tax=Rubrivivax rivuli TaxID=1862385 RepID=A0A437RCJ2_9BURK|nr:PEP-CTERM sorting domain-containing protein [Rubrivivax rivuli]RVU44518.1 hypothetical protein EOE66_17805 [Rubrivivax rivuli]
MPATARSVAATLGLASALVLSATAHAAPTSITYTSKFAVFHNTATGELVSAQRVQDGTSSSFSVEAFDGSLGTLLAVDLSYNARWTTNASLMGYAGTSGCGAACLREAPEADVAVLGRNAALFALFMSGPGAAETLWQRTVNSSLLSCEATAAGEAECQAWSTSQGTGWGGASSSNRRSFTLARFVQSESVQHIDFTARTTGTVDIQACSLGTSPVVAYCRGQSAGWLNGTLSITYTFEAAQQAVPLPSTLALLLAAGGLLAWQRRRAA